MKKILVFFLVGLFSFFTIHTIVISADGLNNHTANNIQADVAVILGNKVHPNREVSKRLKARLNRGVELYHNKQTPHIIVSGGLGKEGWNEAIVMRDYLLAQNIPLKAIIVDEQGNNTRLTALHTQAIMQQKELKSVIVVSQFYHISRTKLAFKQLNIQKVYGASPTYFEWRDMYALLREWPAYYVYWWTYKKG